MKKNYVITLILSFCSVFCMAQQKDFFDELSGMKGISSVYISKAMFQLMPDMNMGGLNLTPFIRKLESVRILSSENVETTVKMKKNFQYINPENGYEELMRVTDNGEKMVIYWKQDKKGKNEFVLLSDEEKEYTAIVIVGNLTLEEMQKIAQGK